MPEGFDLVDCSWPRPVCCRDGRWVSEPEWDAPRMPRRPPLREERLDDGTYRMIDWKEHFHDGLAFHDGYRSGQMQLFHVVFRIRVHLSGRLVFWDDDGSIVRRGGEVLHEDRTAHSLRRHEIEVEAGEDLEIAQWQLHRGWLWAGRVEPRTLDPREVLAGYLPRVRTRLRRPSGPPLKLYTNGAHPARAILAVYSLILHGYAPSEVVLFGEHQWREESRGLLRELLPFARVEPTDRVLGRIRELGGDELVARSLRSWPTLKACLALLLPPEEFCLVDDDIFVLGPTHDAVRALAGADLVFAPDFDHGESYQEVWSPERRDLDLPTRRFNAGVYWGRVVDEPREIAARMLRVDPHGVIAWHWEQGFIAVLYRDREVVELPSQRYFYPIVDGLPGGVEGYDYRHNPCGFATVHFGGLVNKPDDALSLQLAHQVLAPKRPIPAPAAAVPVTT